MAFPPTHILSQNITPAAAAVLNLGVSFEENFKIYRKHVAAVFYHIGDLCRNRRYISLSAAKPIATVVISSILDYCNFLVYNAANKDIAKLQRVHNCLARVLMRFLLVFIFRSVALLKSLHWLPVHYRNIFKI
ncbi:hypothetical protein NP493_3264g00008 [Ridgeia piscesae]|uniref:Uncharacterized protein n=1 Tax=Ridgeia piscesae TaxID=27915 RepID=A0AAD9J8R4_RIDPI|nr:hypothetical protein NP493_3264g00008 [Ridgeia piscesae]